MNDCESIDLRGTNCNLEANADDSFNLTMVITHANGTPIDFIDSTITFELRYTGDTKKDPIFIGTLSDTESDGLFWTNVSDKSDFQVHIPQEVMSAVKFPLKSPKKLVCDYAIKVKRFLFTGDEVVKTVCSGEFKIYR